MAWPTGAVFLFSTLPLAASPSQAAISAVQQVQQSAPPPTGKSQTGQDANPFPITVPPPPTGTSARDAQTLREIEANYLRAEMENNPALAESILADDYIGIKGDGSTADKLEVLRNLARNESNREPYKIVASDMRTQVFGDTACVIYTKIYTVPGRNATYSENLLHIFTKRNGIWRLQVSSPIPAPRHEPAPHR